MYCGAIHSDRIVDLAPSPASSGAKAPGPVDRHCRGELKPRLTGVTENNEASDRRVSRSTGVTPIEHQHGGAIMKKLSERLSELAVRAKNTEDVIAATRSKDRARLDAQQSVLKASIATASADAKGRASAAKDSARGQWGEARSSVEQRFETMRADADERRVERGIKKAEHHAEAAEQDAADAIDFALYVLDQAEYALIAAAIARADADDLALQS
jgi:hypothetical protein